MKSIKHLRIFILPTLLLLFMSLASPLSINAKPGGGGTVNLPPVIQEPVNPSFTTPVNTPLPGKVTAIDPEGATVKYALSIRPVNGAVVLSATTGAWTYTPNNNFIGTDTFTVKASDPAKKYALSKITITVTGVTPPPPPTSLHYTALGDSIATGTIYPGSSIKPYVHYFEEYLEGLSATQDVVLHDLPVDGYQTRDLYNGLGLQPGVPANQAMIDAVVAADVITISIGGNNLMQAAVDSGSITGYDFFNPDFALADKGLKDFNDQFVAVIDKINLINTKLDLKIIVNTQYNPYDVSENSYLHNMVDTYLTGTKIATIDGVQYALSGINDVVNSNASTHGYEVADVFTGFDTYDDNMIMVDYLYATSFWELLTRNPHPRSFGQEIITQKVQTQYAY